jgi:hypothetical protein
MKEISVRELVKKYLMCVLFSFLLFVIVWLSEMLRYIVTALALAMSSGVFVLNLFGVYIFFLFVFGIVPLCLLPLLLIYPKLMKAFFATFGVTEKLLDKKKKNEDKNGDTKTEQI